LCEENADAVEHHLDVFVQSGAEEEEEEEEEEDGNRYVIPCFFRKSRMCWIYSELYGRVRVSLGYCQMLISQIGLSGVLPTTFSVQLGTTSIRFASLKIVSVSWHRSREQNNRQPYIGRRSIISP